MMTRICKYIWLAFFLTVAMSQGFVVAAEEAAVEGVIARPVMEYKSGNLRDPFKTYLVKEAFNPITLDPTGLVEVPQFDPDKLQVQGIIWGGKIPQTIISDKVYTIGDLIEGAEIISIEKKGVTLNFNGQLIDLTVPRQTSSSKETKKK